VQLLQTDIAAFDEKIKTAGQVRDLDDKISSYLVHVNGGVIRLKSVENTKATGEIIIALTSDTAAANGTWRIQKIDLPETSRKLTDREITFLDALKDKGLVKQSLSYEFFTQGASREAEQAGVWVSVVGSFLTLFIVMLISFPLGVGAAIYLEEFAPKNRFTEIIEVNINNLAAVPSIIFGLLGLAIFLNAFGMPRSAPVVGGLVLALMTMPVIIIATRASLRSVPPSIKEAALGVGASHQQAVFHHIFPLAVPGILTGTILGMARAMGETAPLLMIGMVAFLVDVPQSFTDAATLIPVQIFMWADFPEAAFQSKTAGAIIILLLFMISMNMLAVVLRKKYERRW
jgi:phosphate transport system permease protein